MNNNNNVYLNLLLIVILLLLLNCNLEDKNNDIIDKTKQFIIDNKFYFIFLIVVIVLLILYYYNYEWVNKKINNIYNNEYSDSSDDYSDKLNNNITVIEEVKPNITLYYANWCPHCNSLKPIWNKFYEKNKDNGKYDIKIVDCSESCPNPDVEGYPTILLTNNKGKVLDFSGEIKNEKDLENYVLSNLE